MNGRRALLVAFVGLMLVWPLQTKGDAQAQEKPVVKIPEPAAVSRPAPKERPTGSAFGPVSAVSASIVPSLKKT